MICLKKSGIIYAEPLFSTFNIDEAINFNLNFNSTIPQKLNLEPLENNLVEGIVIRSLKGHNLLKVKNKIFKESYEIYDNNNYDRKNTDSFYKK